MRFNFHTPTIASLSGVALLTTSSHNQVDANVSISSPPLDASAPFMELSIKQGSECSFTNSFKTHVNHVDIGILSCGAYETCVEDAKSSLGGRCTTLIHKEVSVKAHRELVACTFSNGTAGTKCEGLYACSNVNENAVGCGSCIGNDSCNNLKVGSIIGENSCIGSSACYSLQGSVADNSCHGFLSCDFLEGSVADNSCLGDSACDDSQGIIGAKSCNGFYSCYQAEGSFTLGNYSCNGEKACAYITMIRVGDSS
ncbi:hypothetical protein ACHAWX_000651, partial [Stephanocyclus meneghinianus]